MTMFRTRRTEIKENKKKRITGRKDSKQQNISVL